MTEDQLVRMTVTEDQLVHSRDGWKAAALEWKKSALVWRQIAELREKRLEHQEELRGEAMRKLNQRIRDLEQRVAEFSGACRNVSELVRRADPVLNESTILAAMRRLIGE